MRLGSKSGPRSMGHATWLKKLTLNSFGRVSYSVYTTHRLRRLATIHKRDQPTNQPATNDVTVTGSGHFPLDISPSDIFPRTFSPPGQVRESPPFLPHDAMHLPSAGIRPSVRFVSCAKTNKDIFEIFSPCGSQAILVFAYQTGWRYSNGNLPNGGVECKGV